MAHHRILSLSALTLYVVAAAGMLIGWNTVALFALLVGIALSVVGEVLSARRTETQPDLADEQVARLRADRDSLGEVAAVSRLRTEYPDLSLVTATRIVREL